MLIVFFDRSSPGTFLKVEKEILFFQRTRVRKIRDKIIRDVFGTVKEDGYRQYNTAYVEVPKKNGKSELAAAVALYLTCGDGEWGAEVYGCAADRQQASIVFDVAVDMVEQSPALKKRIKPVLSRKRLVYMPTGSFYQVLSSEAYTKHGFNVHGVVFDELHAQPNRQLYDVMTKGSGDARAGFTVVPFGQGYKDMSPPTKELMKLTLEGKIAHGGHPALTWMMDNIHVQTDPAGNIKPDKTKSTEKIDGAVAMIMAFDRCIRNEGIRDNSVYDERGLLII
jgi:phage terminase large subunit-like protein